MSFYGEALTWDKLASDYDKANSGRRARTLPMQKVLEWAKKQDKKYYICPVEGTVHYLLDDSDPICTECCKPLDLTKDVALCWECKLAEASFARRSKGKDKESTNRKA